MTQVVCTLFEGDYHFGVAALANSLYRNGYRGAIYAGYRGAMPPWCPMSETASILQWTGAYTLTVADGLKIHLLPLTTNYHLTNYKPDFMLSLLSGPAQHAEAIFYFDPDIVVASNWIFFEKWINCGVALCEDVNSPMPKNHPHRVGWRGYFIPLGMLLSFKESTYANGGFVGLRSQDTAFLTIWKEIQEGMSAAIGGLNRSSLKGPGLPDEITNYHSPFSKTDQDALNAAVEAYSGDVSFVGKEGMAFKNGNAIMPHAVGTAKPWDINLLARALNGHGPRVVDRAYWKVALDGPIVFHARSLAKRKVIAISIAAFIGRFYRRN